MAVDRQIARLDLDAERVPYRADRAFEHHATVRHRILLRPMYGGNVIVEILRPFGQVRKIFIWQVDEVLAHVGFGQFGKIRSDQVPNPARSAMQHHPDALLFIEANFDEVIPRAERTEMSERSPVVYARMLIDDGTKRGFERIPRAGHRLWRLRLPGARIVTLPMIGPSMRNRRLDVRTQIRKIIRQLRRRKRHALRDHTAADVDSDRSRNDRAARCDDAPDGCSPASVNVRHDGDVLE